VFCHFIVHAAFVRIKLMMTTMIFCSIMVYIWYMLTYLINIAIGIAIFR